MIAYEEAFAQTMAAARPLPAESVGLEEVLGRILAEDVRADADMPPFDRSTMDGYACRREDLAGEWLTVIEEIPAGAWPKETVRPGTCARVLTGAPVPGGADCVVMQEQTEREGSRLRILRADTPDNIGRQAEDVRRGERVLSAGELVTPARLAVLAAVGCVRPRVACRPRVTVFATGNELVEPQTRPEGGKIRNSNGCQLCAQLRTMGVTGRYEGIVPDDLALLVGKIEPAQADADLLLVSGGVAEGDYDLVPEAFRRCGYRLLFESVAMRPGRPTVFGTDGKSFCCGLPGNPVSAFVVFELLLRPFLYALMGRRERTRTVPAVLARTFRCRKTDRQSTIPVRFQGEGRVAPVEYHGSAHLAAMAQADALLTIPVGVSEVEEGTAVHVRPL
jgi:molybdopterin molybdotransferase